MLCVQLWLLCFVTALYLYNNGDVCRNTNIVLKARIFIRIIIK